MSSLEQHPGLDRAATEWVVRLTSGRANKQDVAAARAWCELSQDHKAAFERARRLWWMAGPQDTGAARATSKRGLAIAASLLLAVSIGAAAVKGHWSADYQTASGEREQITLDDGSSVLLDSQSALDVEYSAGKRTVRLRAGQALFSVESDPNRPFIVQSQDVSAAAVGTVYSVRRDGDATDVVVSEGVVKVDSADATTTFVRAGERATHAKGSPALTKQSADVDTALAWQRGLLMFELVSLEQVVAEINRHRPGYIVIANPQLRDLKVSGVFHLGQLDEGLDTLAMAFPIRISSITPYLLVLR